MAVPLVLLLSILIVSGRYRWHQYIAMLIAMGGMTVTLIPQFDGSQFDVALPWELVTNNSTNQYHPFID